MYSVIMGHLGTDAVAANGIANISKNLVVCFCLGLGNAGSIIVGNRLGADRLQEAKEVGETLTKTAIIAGIVSGLVLIALSPFITKMVDLTPDSPRISAKNAADLFLLHRRKISKLYDNRRNLRSRRRLQIWNAV